MIERRKDSAPWAIGCRMIDHFRNHERFPMSNAMTHDNGAEVLDAEPTAPARMVGLDASRDQFAQAVAMGMLAKLGAPEGGGEENWAKQVYMLAGALMDQRAIVEAEEAASQDAQKSRARVANRPNVPVPQTGVRR